MAIHLYDGILPVNSQQEGVLVTMEVIFSWRRQLNNQTNIYMRETGSTQYDDRNYSIHEQRKIIEKINKWTEPMGQYQKV